MGLPTKNKAKTSTRTAKTKQKHGLGEQTQANTILQMFLLMRKFGTHESMLEPQVVVHQKQITVDHRIMQPPACIQHSDRSTSCTHRHMWL